MPASPHLLAAAYPCIAVLRSEIDWARPIVRLAERYWGHGASSSATTRNEGLAGTPATSAWAVCGPSQHGLPRFLTAKQGETQKSVSPGQTGCDGRIALHDLANFYAHLLGQPVTADEPPNPGDPAGAGWAQIRPPEGEPGPTLNFEYERHFTRPVWPSIPGEQTASQHLDIQVTDLGAVGWSGRWPKAPAWRISSLRTGSGSCSSRPATRFAYSE